MPFPAKQRICPSAHPDLCLATILPCGRSGGWDRSIREERTPSGRSWRASPPTSSCCSEKPSTRGAAAMRSAPARSPRPRGLSAGPEVPGLRRPQRLEGRFRKLLPKGRELRFDRLAPADLALAMSHVDRRAGAVRLSLESGAEGLAKHGPGPVETHPHRSFNWENNGPGPPRTVQGRSARCGNTLSVQSARWG